MELQPPPCSQASNAQPPLDRGRAEALEKEIIELSAHLNAASYRFLELIAEFDRDEHWGWYGVATCAQWLNWQCGLGEVAAREHVRVARALQSLPQISASFSRGEISYSKVRAMTRIATAATEATLLNIARYGTAGQLDRLVTRYRRFERLEADRDPEQLYRGRYVRYRYEEDGSMYLYAKLPPELGEIVKKAIEAGVDTLCEDGARGRSEAQEEDTAGAASSAAANQTQSNVPAEASVSAAATPSSTPPTALPPIAAHRYRTVPGSSAVEEFAGQGWSETIGRRRADGLRLLAEQFLSSGLRSGGASADRYQVVVHIDQRLLSSSPRPAESPRQAAEECTRCNTPGKSAHCESAEDADDAEGALYLERCELDDGRALAIETARRLGCDCSLVGIVEDEEGEPLNVGRKTRSLSPALSRALASRDGGCRFPGCGRTLFTEGHHVVPWAKGGETKLSNLVTLCSYHHRLVHTGGFGLRVTEDGGFEFTRPDGTRIEANGENHARAILATASPPPEAMTGQGYPSLFGINRRRGLEIDHTTAASRWIGDKLDYGWTVDDLVYYRDRARRQVSH
jgi:hypothetical protein